MVGSKLWNNFHNQFLYIHEVISKLPDFKEWLENELGCEVEYVVRPTGAVSGLTLNFDDLKHETFYRLQYSEDLT